MNLTYYWPALKIAKILKFNFDFDLKTILASLLQNKETTVAWLSSNKPPDTVFLHSPTTLQLFFFHILERTDLNMWPKQE